MSIAQVKVYAALPETERAKPVVLGPDPSGVNFTYANGQNVYIRKMDDPSICDIYSQHSNRVSVAKYSPCGNYVASADIKGHVRVWNALNTEHSLSHNFQPLSNPIRDLAWSPDSKRMAFVGGSGGGGGGNTKFTHVILLDSKASIGSLSGHGKTVNSCDWRATRPFRVITGSDDGKVGVFEGPPFKPLAVRSETLGSFVQTVRYAPDGSVFATGDFKGRVFVHDGISGDLICSLEGEAVRGAGRSFTSSSAQKSAHAGGVYAVSWSDDGKQLLTASGDRTCRIFDVERHCEVAQCVMGTTVEYQQLGCLWQAGRLITVSMNGTISFLDPATFAEGPVRSVHGHNTAITALAALPSRQVASVAAAAAADDAGGEKVKTAPLAASDVLVTVSYDGRCSRLDLPSGCSLRVTGTGHGCNVSDACVARTAAATGGGGSGGAALRVLTIGFDNCVRWLNPITAEYDANSFKLDAQPKAVAAMSDGDSDNGDAALIVVAIETELVALSGAADSCAVVARLAQPKCVPTAVTCCGQLHHVAVVSSNSRAITVYHLANTNQQQQVSFELVQQLEHSVDVLNVSYSPNGQYLAACDSSRFVLLFSTGATDKSAAAAAGGYAKLSQYSWQLHLARITCLAWSTDSQLLASGSIDASIRVWCVAKPAVSIVALHAHDNSSITRLRWLDTERIVSVGQDCNLRLWHVTQN